MTRVSERAQPNPTAGRPRDAAIDERIDEAARSLLDAGGYGAVTISEVARLAGLPRSTVYRRYPTLAALRYSALYIPPAGIDPVPETGDIRADMRAHIAANATAFRADARSSLRTLLADVVVDDEARADLADRYTLPRLRDVAATINRAKQRGDLAPNLDADVAAKAITGTLIYHALILDQDVDDALLDALVDLLFPTRPS